MEYDTAYTSLRQTETFSILLEPWSYAIFAAVVIFATSTACNLTDGLDGLAIGPTVVSASTFVFLCYLAGTSIMLYLGVEVVEVNGVKTETHTVKVVRIPPPAQSEGGRGARNFVRCHRRRRRWIPLVQRHRPRFHGGCRCASSWGALGAVAVFTKHEFLSVIIHGIFVVEFLSVIIQRYSFKWTGKRVFRMAPIHHHYEKKGWPGPALPFVSGLSASCWRCSLSQASGTITLAYRYPKTYCRYRTRSQRGGTLRLRSAGIGCATSRP